MDQNLTRQLSEARQALLFAYEYQNALKLQLGDRGVSIGWQPWSPEIATFRKALRQAQQTQRS